jgi:hypothetical protein
MLAYDHAPPPAGPASPITAQLDLERPLGGQVQHGLNLFLPLKAPVQMPALLALIQNAKPKVFKQLALLDYVHFARFLPSPDGSVLWVITTFDGDLEPYIMDFVGTIGDVFTEILFFIKGAPPLPVQRYPREFVAFVNAHNIPQADVWSAYPDLTVLDIHAQAARS